MARRRGGRSPLRRAIRCAATAATALLIVAWPVNAQVAPTPTPSDTPLATPTPTDTPVPAPTPTDTPAPPAPTSTAAPTAAAPSHPVPKPAAPSTPKPRAAAPKLLAPTAGSFEFTLTSAAMTVTNLAFAGTSTVTSGTASLTVLQFTAASASLAGFTEKEPCQFSAGGSTWQVVHSMPAAQSATLGGPITLLATSLSYTPPGGPTVTFDATTPPPVGVLVPAGTLPQVELTATSLVAASMTAPQLSVSVATC